MTGLATFLSSCTVSNSTVVTSGTQAGACPRQRDIDQDLGQATGSLLRMLYRLTHLFVTLCKPSQAPLRLLRAKGTAILALHAGARPSLTKLRIKRLQSQLHFVRWRFGLQPVDQGLHSMLQAVLCAKQAESRP